jgi:hypothetical protein
MPSPSTQTDTFRPRALENLHRVPDGYFSVMGELFKHLYNLEALFNRSLDELSRYGPMPAPKTKKPLPSPIERSPSVQSPFEWE